MSCITRQTSAHEKTSAIVFQSNTKSNYIKIQFVKLINFYIQLIFSKIKVFFFVDDVIIIDDESVIIWQGASFLVLLILIYQFNNLL